MDSGVGGVGVAAPKDGVFEPLAELGRSSQDALVDKVDQGEVLKQVVLDRGSFMKKAVLHKITRSYMKSIYL